jgi:hypothetical protein
MKMLRVIATLICLAQASGASGYSAKEIMARNQDKLVTVLSLDSKGTAIAMGSGFVIADNGVIASSLHVVDHAHSILVKPLDTNATWAVSHVVNYDSKADVVLLKTSLNRQAVLLAGKEETGVGDRVFVIGNPAGLEGTISDGIVSSLRKLQDGINLIQITAPISPGSSGGPVLNTNNKVIGIAAATVLGGQNLNFAVPIAFAAGLLARPDLKMRVENLISTVSQAVWFREIDLPSFPVPSIWESSYDLRFSPDAKYETELHLERGGKFHEILPVFRSKTGKYEMDVVNGTWAFSGRSITLTYPDGDKVIGVLVRADSFVGVRVGKSVDSTGGVFTQEWIARLKK